MEPDNGNNKNYNSDNNFKLKGPKGWVHKLRKKAKGIVGNAQDTFKDRVKKIFKAIFFAIMTIIKILLPVILFLSACWYVISSFSHDKSVSTVSSYISNSVTLSAEAKEAYEATGSLVYLKDKEIKEISNEYLKSLQRANNSLYEELTREKVIGSNTISKISYADGFDISNAYEFILNAERLNFNRVSWKKYDRETGEITDLETQVDEETNLKYPKNDEDTTKGLNYFVDAVTSYLQSYVVPSAMLSGITSKGEQRDVVDFAFQIIDKGYHVIDVLQYTLQTAKRDQTKKHYITKSVSLTIYEHSYECSDGYDENGNEIITTCWKYGYSRSELEEKKEAAREDYETAVSNNAETVEVYKNFDRVIEKQFVYPVIKADTLKEFLRAEYEQKKYSDEDVENYTNSDLSYVTNVEALVEVDGLNYDPAGFGWNPSSTITIEITSGDYITTKYTWSDKLEEKYNESRNYEVNDISEFVNKTDKIVEVEERELTEEEMTAGSRPDLRLDATKIFSQREISYYEELEEDKDITRIDMINATPSIYKEYLYDGDNYSEYIGYSRPYLSFSYTLLNKHITELAELKKSTTNWNGISLGGLTGLNMIWPLDSYGYITSTFGVYRPELGQNYGHGAIDITPTANLVYPNKPYTGSYVYAASSGTVEAMFKETPRDQGNSASKCPDTAQGANYTCGGVSSYGRYIKIKDENGYMVIYGHLYEIADGIEVGSKIEQGQVLGVMGTTGSSTGVHLHFEVRKSPWGWENDRIDPLSIESVLTAREIIKNGGAISSTIGSSNSGSSSSGSSSNSTATSSNTGTTYSGGKFVFSQEITSALSSASYNDSTFNRTLTSGGSYYKTTGISNISGTSYSSRTKPDTFAAKDAAIKNMSDLEILSRTIYAEQGSNSEEAGVLVGISVLNRVKKDKSSISAVLTGKYESDTKYNYNCVSGNVFWGDIPEFAKELAIKALAAVDKGSYVVAGVECVNIESFHASTTINSGDSYRISENDLSVGSTWYNWKRYLVLENTISGFKYTGFYGW